MLMPMGQWLQIEQVKYSSDITETNKGMIIWLLDAYIFKN